MKIALTLLTITTLFTACVDKNGFDNFNFTPQQEHWENNQVNSRIQDKNGVQGTISAVYLNKVMPLRYKDGEYFYITIYLKDPVQKPFYTLNEQPATSLKELDGTDEFKSFISNQNNWSRNYIVSFAEQKDEDILSLEAKNSIVSSNKMIFKKDE